MTNDFTLFDAHTLLEHVGFSDRAEHEGYLRELESLDYSNEDQARLAIRKWLLPAFNAWSGQTEIGRRRVRLAFRVALSRWGFVPHGPGFPGIEEECPPYRSPQETYRRLRQFHLWVWDELFQEPFVPLPDMDSLLERDDVDFANAPNDPSAWGAPHYRPITYWDGVLRTDAWRENWPPVK